MLVLERMALMCLQCLLCQRMEALTQRPQSRLEQKILKHRHHPPSLHSITRPSMPPPSPMMSFPRTCQTLQRVNQTARLLVSCENILPSRYRMIWFLPSMKSTWMFLWVLFYLHPGYQYWKNFGWLLKMYPCDRFDLWGAGGLPEPEFTPPRTGDHQHCLLPPSGCCVYPLVH